MTNKLLSKRYFRSVSLLTVLSLVMYMFAAIVLVRVEAAAITNASDTMSRLEVSVADVEHTFVFTPTSSLDEDDGVQITMDSAFGDASLDIADYSISQAAGGTPCVAWTENVYVPTSDVIQFECDTAGAAGTGAITVSITTDLDNPATVGSYDFLIETYDLGADTDFAGGDDVLEDTGSVEVAIVDDDTVNVTGFIREYLTFDIDTDESDVDCDAAGGTTPCDSHSAAGDSAGYVVSLGLLDPTDAAINDSGDAGVLHADNLTGTINYIWFDTSTNAQNGVVVTVLSLTGENDVDGTPTNTVSALEGPTGNEIRSVAAGDTVIADGSGLYGISFAADDTGTNTVSSGTAASIAADYDQDSAAEFGRVPSDSGGGTPLTIYSSSGPLDQSRVQFEVAADPDALDEPGTYTDELTFIATATF